MAELRQIGALPIKVREDGMPAVLLITSRRRGRWIIPKGWPLDGRSDPEAAAIEAWEEAGIQGDAEEEIFGRYDYLKIDEAGDRKITVEVYRLIVRSEADEWPERGERIRQWFTVEEVIRKLDDRELADLIAAERSRLLSGLVV